MKDEKDLKDRLPIGSDADDLFDTCSDGLVLIYFLKSIDPKLIDMSEVFKGKNPNTFQTRQNLEYALKQSEKIIKLVGVDAQTFIDKTPHLMLGVLWQLVQHKRKTSLKKKISRKGSEEFVAELHRGEKEGFYYSDKGELNDDLLLFKWFNSLVRKAGLKSVRNLGKDLSDSKHLIHALNQLDPETCSLDALKIKDDTERAEAMLKTADEFGCAEFIGPDDIITGNYRVNTVLISEMFDIWHHKNFEKEHPKDSKKSKKNKAGAEESKKNKAKEAAEEEEPKVKEVDEEDDKADDDEEMPDLEN